LARQLTCYFRGISGLFSGGIRASPRDTGEEGYNANKGAVTHAFMESDAWLETSGNLNYVDIHVYRKSLKGEKLDMIQGKNIAVLLTGNTRLAIDVAFLSF
jgi:hypothetical protein